LKKKLVIIGLDGGTYNVINPLLQRGKLPFLSKFIKTGAYGILKSTFPPVTAPAWTTFMTGKNPGNHGLFDFQKIDESGERSLTYSTDCKSATLWEYLSKAGFKQILVNIPMTYPPRKINGICIAGFPAPDNVNYVYPADMFLNIKNKGYITDWTEYYEKNRWKSKIHILKKVEEKRLSIFSDLLNKYPWDIAMIVISGTDHIAHFELQKGNQQAVAEHYEFVDSLLNNLEEKKVFQDASLLVMSDHGFVKTDYIFHLNNWLRSEGYLSYTAGLDKTYDKFAEERRKTVYGKKSGISGLLGALGLTRDNLIYFGKKTGLIRLERYIPHFIIRKIPSRDASPLWENTSAYMTSDLSKGININLAGREKYGIVSREKFSLIRDEIVNKLRSLKDDNGNNIFSFVDIKENVYKGKKTNQSPDIVLLPSEKFNIKPGIDNNRIQSRIVGARHDIKGIFMFRGSEIRQRRSIDLSIEDLAPSILHFMGSGCPEDMDGSAATEIFERGSDTAKRSVNFIGALNGDYDQDFIQEQESVSNKLKALGYL
jgi:predicted AlkP superfamily phosphohydrolase/phosphomutase